ncbi:MAG TPA: hypothetical protein DDZ76_10185 [Xanthomonadales bacterium]|nr:hypothetical protein [Xanthomonadales bacterium]
MGYERGSGGVSGTMVGPRPARLMDEVRRCLRLKHYSLHTEQAYVGWIRRFILASGKRHPREIGGPEVERFLSSLAVQARMAASTQNQALSALLFLYREVLSVDLPWLDNVTTQDTHTPAPGPPHGYFRAVGRFYAEHHSVI